jgi:hypothetical protein
MRYTSANIERRRAVEFLVSDGALNEVISVREYVERNTSGKDVPSTARSVLRALRTHFFRAALAQKIQSSFSQSGLMILSNEPFLTKFGETGFRNAIQYLPNRRE